MNQGNFPKDNPRIARGISLLEVMFALAIISLALVPITHNFATSHKIAAAGNSILHESYLAQAKMEELLAQDFAALVDANGTAVLGEAIDWEARVSLFDGDSDGHPDLDLKHLSLRIGDIELQTLKLCLH